MLNLGSVVGLVNSVAYRTRLTASSEGVPFFLRGENEKLAFARI